MKMRALAAIVGLSMILLACPKEAPKSDGEGGAAAPGARLKIAVIPKGTTHEFWKSVHAGAVKAAKEADVDIVWKGPLRRTISRRRSTS